MIGSAICAVTLILQGEKNVIDVRRIKVNVLLAIRSMVNQEIHLNQTEKVMMFKFPSFNEISYPPIKK